MAQSTHLEAWKVWVLQTNLVALPEILGDSTLDSLAGIELQRECLRLRGASCHLKHAVFALHIATVCDLHLQACKHNTNNVDYAVEWSLKRNENASSASWQWTCTRTSTVPRISLVNLSRCASVSGRRCSFRSRISSTSHMNSITDCSL